MVHTLISGACVQVVTITPFFAYDRATDAQCYKAGDKGLIVRHIETHATWGEIYLVRFEPPLTCDIPGNKHAFGQDTGNWFVPARDLVLIPASPGDPAFLA